MADEFEQDWADVLSGYWAPSEVASGQDITGNADAAAMSQDAQDWYDSFLTSIGITPSTATGTGASPSNSEIATSIGLPNLQSLSGIAKALFVNPNGSLNTGMLGAVLGGVGGAMGLGQTQRAPSGYQGGIPRYTATRQAPVPGQRISGNVTYTAKAEGGELESGGFVIPADVVSHFGNGSSDAGLKVLASKLGAEPIRGEGDGMSDSIKTTIDGDEPAKVAHEEAFVSRSKVAALGGGDEKKGAQKLRTMMARIREARTGSAEQGKQINPSKYMPGGEVKGYAAGDVTGSAISSGLTGTESNLSNWAGPYVTEMLGKGQALSEMPYEAYSGPLTAGPSALQAQAFEQAGGLQTPAAIGQAATTAGGIAEAAKNLNYTPVGTTFGTTEAQQYMNPFLKAALDPQMAEMKRQADIQRMADAARLTKAGAYGGSRQAIMESEGARNLLDLQTKALGTGYSTAYDKAMAQFNADQARKVQEAQYGSTLGLQGLQAATQAAQAQGQLGATQSAADIAGVKTMADLGATQRGIAAEDVAAQKAAFEEARLNPYKMVQFQQSLLSGLPLAAQTYNVAQPSTLQQILAGLGGGAKLGNVTTADINTALKNLGINVG